MGGEKMEINGLVERIDNIRSLIQSKGSNADIFRWLSDCQVYLENSHNKLEYTKQFINEKENLKLQIISMEIYSIDIFDSLAATMQSVKDYENDKSEKTKKTTASISNLTSKRNDVPKRTLF